MKRKQPLFTQHDEDGTLKGAWARGSIWILGPSWANAKRIPGRERKVRDDPTILLLP